MDKLLLTEQPGVIYPFDYAATGMTGILELLEVDADQDPPIFKVSIEVLRKSKLLFSKELMLQRDKRDRWKVIENMNT